MEQTILVECSRQSSLEGTTQNFTTPAEWTCGCGDGLVLDIGDKIQVHSGFVSEKGAQAGAIEIKERVRAIKQKAIISKEIQYLNPYTSFPTVGDAPINTDIYDFGCEIAGNEEHEFTINDGETNIVFSPYKTTNGEHYISLPRRHIGNASGNTGKVNPYEVWDNTIGVTPATAAQGIPGSMGNILYNLDPGGEHDSTIWAPLGVANQFCPADYKIVGKNGANSEPTLPPAAAPATLKKGMIRNDCSRYTLFRAEKIYRDRVSASDNSIPAGQFLDLLGGSGGQSGEAPGTVAYQAAYDERDPAILYTWSPVKEVFKMKSKDGFNSPSDVAAEITEQMNKRGILQKRDFKYATETINGYYAKNELVNYYESPLFKTYNCANYNYNSSNYELFKNVAATGADIEARTNSAHMYMSQYQHIGVKRPDLWIQGRKTNGSTGFLKSATGDGKDTPRNAQVLNLGIPWTEDELLNLNDLFVIQAKYPELFEGVYQSTNQPLNLTEIKPGLHRYLHFNRQDDTIPLAGNPAGTHRHCPIGHLGYDLYGQDHAIPAGFHYDNSMATYPLFFDYNENTASYTSIDVAYCEDGVGLSDINDLAYGWARKVRVQQADGSEKFYIGVQFTRTGNEVPSWLYNGISHIANSGAQDPVGRRFGFDYHFSAYGSSAIVMYNGLVPNDVATAVNGQFPVTDYGGDYQISKNLNDEGTVNKINTGALYHKILLGADAPSLIYDSQEDRFSFDGLHTGERAGNVGNAGRIKSGAKLAVAANQQAESICYKVNKAMLGTTYCPNVAPYPEPKLEIAATGQYPAQLMFSNNLEPWTIYDATCGLFIEEIIVPEKTWDENLIGVLGYFYNQFSNEDTSRQTQINNRLDSSNMKSLTTQAIIGAGDMLEWTKNGYGNSIFTLNPPLSYQRLAAKQNILPPVTVFFKDGEGSTRITAVDLPTKTARPYFTIRSDILPQSSFVGGNQDLTLATANAVNRPVVAIVNKINGYGDFYSQQETQLNFTNTEKRVITAIKTSVHDPDGSYSKVDKSSSVIYKITKTKQIDLTPVETLLKSQNEKQVKEGQLLASMLKNPDDVKPNYSQTFSFS